MGNMIPPGTLARRSIDLVQQMTLSLLLLIFLTSSLVIAVLVISLHYRICTELTQIFLIYSSTSSSLL